MAGKFPRVPALREAPLAGVRAGAPRITEARSSAGRQAAPGSRGPAGSLSRALAAESPRSSRGEPRSVPLVRPAARPPAQDALAPRTKGTAAGERGDAGRCLLELCGHRPAAPQLRSSDSPAQEEAEAAVESRGIARQCLRLAGCRRLPPPGNQRLLLKAPAAG